MRPNPFGGRALNVWVELAVGKFEKYVGMAWTVKWAVAGQIATPQLMTDIVDADEQPSSQEVLPVPTHGLLAAQVQWMRITPFGWARHHDRFGRELCPPSSRSLKSTWHARIKPR